MRIALDRHLADRIEVEGPVVPEGERKEPGRIAVPLREQPKVGVVDQEGEESQEEGEAAVGVGAGGRVPGGPVGASSWDACVGKVSFQILDRIEASRPRRRGAPAGRVG